MAVKGNRQEKEVQMNRILMFVLILAGVLIPLTSFAGSGSAPSEPATTTQTEYQSGDVWVGHVDLLALNSPCHEETEVVNPASEEQKPATGEAVAREPAAHRQDVPEKAPGPQCRAIMKTWIGHTDVPSWACS